MQMNAPVCNSMSYVVIADIWFPPEERTLATSIGNLAIYLGMNYGFIFPSIMLRKASNGQQSLSDSFDQIKIISYTNLAIMFVALVCCALFVRSKPNSPPSISAGDTRFNIKDSFKLFVKDIRSFMDIVTLSVCNSSKYT
jgi:hypothetical protein